MKRPTSDDLFITFGGGRSGFRSAAKRLGGEVSNSSWKKDVLVLNESTASLSIGSEWVRHESWMKSNKKGFGFWLWKPLILKSALEGKFGRYQRVFYLDAGSQFSLESQRSSKRFDNYLETVSSGGGLAFSHRAGQFGIDDFSENRWSEPELHKLLGSSQQIINSPQIQAGCLFLTEKTYPVILKWLEVALTDSYRYLSGSEQNLEGLPGLQYMHRHDQSILSPLWKEAGLPILADETWFGPDWSDEAKNFPIWTIRNDSSITLPVRNRIEFFKHKVQVYSLNVMDRLNLGHRGL